MNLPQIVEQINGVDNAMTLTFTQQPPLDPAEMQRLGMGWYLRLETVHNWLLQHPEETPEIQSARDQALTVTRRLLETVFGMNGETSG